MLKKWIRDFLGISDLKSRLFNLDNDIVTIMEKQMGQELKVIPADEQPEHDDNSPYEYVSLSERLGQEPTVSCLPKWYCIWEWGFAGPFDGEEQARDYGLYNNINKFNTERLACLPFKMK